MKKVRVIVEVKSPNVAEYNQRHLVNYVARALEQGTMNWPEYMRHMLPPSKVQVKRFSNVQGYETRVLRKKVTER